MSACVHVCERESVCVCACVWKRERESVYVSTQVGRRTMCFVQCACVYVYMYCVALALPHVISGKGGFAYLAGAAPGAKMHHRFGAQKMQRVKMHSLNGNRFSNSCSLDE